MLFWLSKAEKRFKDRENLFSSWHKFSFSKKHFLAIFRIILQKTDIISDVIIAIAAILKFFFYQFFCNITMYNCAKFHVKSIFLSGFMQGSTLCPPPPRGMIRQRYPRADRVEHVIIKPFGVLNNIPMTRTKTLVNNLLMSKI